ncbi:ATP-dependent helicase [Acinetobacter bereziniae]|uniref:ATP-dependent helicase n=1 Tax=Acinetobacter bereziniae TaxID=106648 RepID=UPI0021CD1AE9|nr:ATP-dependent helicase [Acinetobacter bereziniae]MCU4538021.1 ATP-dependent helicase [Acinetobacter bereziniae]
MFKHTTLQKALSELEKNKEQFEAVQCKSHCVVLAGPGSGKTKTLTTAIARTLHEEVIAPRAIACITYNNECAIELETRLAKLGVETTGTNFIGTVHGFALTQIIIPYSRCVECNIPQEFKVADAKECRIAIEDAYKKIYRDSGDPHKQWEFAKEKRNRELDRTLQSWKGHNKELAEFIEQYEQELRKKELIDFDDMPLLAFRMIKENPWIRKALEARFPILFIDEYQDLGYGLHELVQLLCFDGNIRLFAVGDADQSIYGFAGANPELLESLIQRTDVQSIQLRFNYRSGTKIVKASSAALNENRHYESPEGTPEGVIIFNSVNGGIEEQAYFTVNTLLSQLNTQGFKNENIAILYRAAWLGDKLVEALEANQLPYYRTDGNSLIKRSSKFSRFIEDCAKWVAGGWKFAEPPFSRLHKQALNLVYSNQYTQNEEQALGLQLINFLQKSRTIEETTNEWLLRFKLELVTPWAIVCRNNFQEWYICSELIEKTSPASNKDITLDLFSGKTEGSGRVNLTTFHSSKGREFDAVILFGVNNDVIPSGRDRKTLKGLKEARRLFYVAVTRPKTILHLVYQEKNHSDFLVAFYQRTIQKQ